MAMRADDLPLIQPKSDERFELKIHDVPPEKIIPNGDRYCVEVIDIDETILLNQFLITSQDAPIDPKDPRANPQVEQRGVLPAVVITAGNGHLLGLPDLEPNEKGERPTASVPMFYKEGDVVFIDRSAKGRAIKIVMREVRLINQIDVLAKVDGIRLVRKDGKWEREQGNSG